MNERLRLIVERMRLQPDDLVLEIGYGHGVAATLICQQLRGGHYFGIDRSKKMAAAAIQRNAAHVEAGMAEFHVADVMDFDPGSRRFTKILAVRVGLFHRDPERVESRVRRWLAPRGKIIAVFDEP